MEADPLDDAQDALLKAHAFLTREMGATDSRHLSELDEVADRVRRILADLRALRRRIYQERQQELQ